MFMEERQREIAEIIEKHGTITVAEIAARYGISDESARRDLRVLEQNGLCQRTRGGAIRPQQVGLRPPENRKFDEMPIFDQYREIAREAAKYVRENDVVYLCGGSFGHILQMFLPRDIHYTLVVNTVDLAKDLRDWDNVDVYVAGGKMRRSGSIVDSMATEFVRRMHFDLCFLTGAGLTADFGLSNGTDETAAYQRAVLQNSRRRILLMPGKKVGADAFIRVCEAEKFSLIITDWDCTEEQLAQLRQREIEVTVVENGSGTHDGSPE